MGIMNKTAPIQSGKVYSTLNQPEIFVEYTGVDTDTAKTTVNNTTKQISVTATTYVVEVDINSTGKLISKEDFERIELSTSTKIAVKGENINVLCSAAENRSETDLYYKYYGPQDASGYAYVVKVEKTPISGGTGHSYTVTEELIALMKEDFVTTITVGGVAAGTQINKGDSVADLLQTILKGTQPTTDWKFKYVESENVISGAPASWDSEVILPASVKTTGYTFNEIGKFNMGYFAFAFIKDLGQLKCIYQNGLHINILNLFNRTEIVIDNISYYMYTIAEKAKLSSVTNFKIMWNLDEE